MRWADPNGLSFPCAYLFHVYICVIKQKEREWEGHVTGPNSLSFPCAYVHTFLMRLYFRKLTKSNESHMGNNGHQWRSTNVHETHVKIKWKTMKISEIHIKSNRKSGETIWKRMKVKESYIHMLLCLEKGIVKSEPFVVSEVSWPERLIFSVCTSFPCVCLS